MENRNFQQEQMKAPVEAERIAGILHELGIVHDPIDWQRCGMLAQVTRPDGTHIGDLIEWEGRESTAILGDVRRTLATDIARKALGIERGGHFNHITEQIVPPVCTANWLTEIYFDYNESRYALVGEYIVADAAASLGWQREYQIWQAKADSRCDVPECGSPWYERKVTYSGQCVHVCRRHQEERAEALYLRLHPSLSAQGATEK